MFFSTESPRKEAYHHPSHSRRDDHHHRGEHVYESPPTVFKPNTPRMVVSTTQKRQYHGRVVHIPKSKDSLSSSSEEEPQGQYHHSGSSRTKQVVFRSKPQYPVQYQKQLKSAPARMPVSTLLLRVTFNRLSIVE